MVISIFLFIAYLSFVFIFFTKYIFPKSLIDLYIENNESFFVDSFIDFFYFINKFLSTS